MKRETSCNVSIATEHPLLTEEANLKASYNPGKSGGTFGLPLGAKLLVPEGLCGKKDSISCRVASPSERWRHRPSFPGEHVTSEIFTLTGTVLLKQRSVILILPYYQPEGNLLDLNVKGMWKDETSWVDVGFIQKTDTPMPCVELEVNRLGTFVVTYRPRTEPFQMTPNGGLYHSRMNRNISIRFPRKAVESTVHFNMQITPIPEDRLAFSREYFSLECRDLLGVSEFIDLGPDVQRNFRRNSSVKLPLPAGVEVVSDTCNDIVVLHKVKDEWRAVECNKFTRASVTVEVKNPTKFCVVQSTPDRQQKMQEAVAILEQRLGKETGEVSLFLSLKDKSWMAVLECYAKPTSAAKIQTRQDQGFRVIEKTEIPEDTKKPIISFSKRPPPPSNKVHRPKQPESFELFDSLTWRIEVKDDVKVSPDSDLTQNADLQCFKFLKESYRQFLLQPAVEEERTLKGTVQLTPVGVEDPDLKEQLTLVFHVDIPEEAVREYYFTPEPQPQPEPVKPKLKLDLPVPEEPRPKPVPKPPPAKPRLISMASAMERLTMHPRRVNIPEKEARVISGRSLMTLSRVVNEGLTLAVHLELPESTITGIGFDALSNQRGMSDVCYKILLYWKRSCKDKRDGAVQHLVSSLRSMGKNSVADIVQERHRENKELTMDCFLMAAVAGIDITS